MGCCPSKAALKTSYDIDQAIKREAALLERTHRLLLLGAGNSGKSTFIKQILLIYTKGFSKKRLTEYGNAIRRNIFQGLTELYERSYMAVCPPITNQDFQILADLASSWNEGATSNQEWIKKFNGIWNNPIVQQAWEHKDKCLIEINVK